LNRIAPERAVWQIKRYCDNLTGTQKRAIKRSFSRVAETSKKEGWRITEWHLVMPLDLTSQNLGWLDNFTADAGFPCETNGLLFCDTLAGNYPNVIDYYLRDGKERLQAGMDNLTGILSGRLNRQENEPLMPADVMTDLTLIYKALNACDRIQLISQTTGWWACLHGSVLGGRQVAQRRMTVPGVTRWIPHRVLDAR
jgi:hypothetical protein